MTSSKRFSQNDFGLFSIRLMVGFVFLYHGSQKLFGAFGGYGIEGTAAWMESLGLPLPTLSATLAGLTEFFGGLALITGFLQRWLSIPLALTMLVASFTAHTGFNAASGGMELPLTLAVVVAGLGLTGPGRLVFPPLFKASLSTSQYPTSAS